MPEKKLTFSFQTSKVLKMRSVIMQAFRDHFINRGYYEVNYEKKKCLGYFYKIRKKWGTCLYPKYLCYTRLHCYLVHVCFKSV